MEQMVLRPRSPPPPPPAHAPSHLLYRQQQQQNGYPPEPIRLPSNPLTMYPNQHHQPPPPSSFIPGVIPAHMNPATVNFCTFSPYLPHEVKHRKRTTRTQFKILEETFRIDSKPNLTLRKKLALQLEMSPRAVQVWFQNRRSKEKNMAKKAQEHKDRTDTGARGEPDMGDSDAKLEDDSGSRSPSEAPSTASSSASPGTSQSANATAAPEVLASGLVGHPLPPHAAAAPFYAASPEPDPFLSLRRDSFPALHPTADAFAASSSPSPAAADPLARRRSVDTSLHRLAAHPYAHLARAANDGLYGRRASALPAIPAAPEMNSHHYLHPHAAAARRPQLAHRASMPHALHAQFATHAPTSYLALHRGSVDSAASAHDQQHPHAHAVGPPVLSARTRLLDGGLYAVSARTVSSPIPGPLPEESFTFGAGTATTSGAPSPVGHGHPHEQLNSFAFPPREDGTGSTASSAASFEPYAFESRFGSIVSVAESEASSVTSAFYSDASGACFDSPAEVDYPSGFQPDLRKASCASLYDGFSSLQVNPHGSQDDLSHYTHGLYPSDDVLAVAASVALPPDDPSPVGSGSSSDLSLGGSGSNSAHGSAHGSAYPSPGASTVSPGHSPPAMSRVGSGDSLQQQQQQSAGELAFALTDANGQLVNGGGSGHGSSPSAYGGTPEHAFYGLPQGSSDSLYGMYQQASAGAGAYGGEQYAGHPYLQLGGAGDACYLGPDGKMHSMGGGEYGQPQGEQHHALALGQSAMEFQMPYAMS